jgi:hypothetical protein
MRKSIILDVNPDPDALQWEEDWLERQDVDVVRCGGPHTPGDCPLLEGKACGKIVKADGILFQLNLERSDHRQILKTYSETLDIPVRAVVSEADRDRYRDLLAEVEVVTPPMGPAALDAFASEVESGV